MTRVPMAELSLDGRDAAIDMAKRFMAGDAPEAHANLVLLNAGAAIYLGGKAASIQEGVEVARQSLASGAAAAVLEKVVTYTQAHKPTDK